LCRDRKLMINIGLQNFCCRISLFVFHFYTRKVFQNETVCIFEEKNMTEGCILVADDKPDIRVSLKMLLKTEFSEVIFTDKTALVSSLIHEKAVDVVLLDMNFAAGNTDGHEGFECLEAIKSANKSTQVVLMTAYAGIELAIKGLKQGATDFVVKPWDNDKLIATLKAACKISKATRQIEQLQNREQALLEDNQRWAGRISGDSPEIKKLLSATGKVAATEASVLITGENGTGKELVARLLHVKSDRASKVFMRVDLGSIPASMFEDELFGHVRGAFTDAREARPGRFEVASGGTIFLDEIGNLPAALQPKLLSVLETRTVTRLGSNNPVPVDVRVICATNQSLHNLISSNLFREDLFFRINTVELFVPPLRDRHGDISLLASHFLEIFKTKYRKPAIRFAAGAVERMEKYSWPGNVRELMHAVERSVILSENDVAIVEVSPVSHTKTAVNERTISLEKMERETIEQAIQRNNGNMSKAARELGLGRTTLYRKMQNYGL
jgi:two-component system response regulator HydG